VTTDWHFGAFIVSSTCCHLTFISLFAGWCFSDYKVDGIFLYFPDFITLARWQVCSDEPGIVAQLLRLISSWLVTAEDSVHLVRYF
jgi:hypothetical protein